MSVCTRPAEPAHCRQWMSLSIGRPWCRGCGHLQRHLFPIHLRVRVLEVEVLGDHSPVYGKYGLDHSRNASRRFKMSDVGLYRTDQQRTVRFASAPVDRGCRVDLNRITNLRTGPVRLQIVDVRRQDSSAFKRRLNDPLLCRTVWDCQPLARTVLVECCTSNHTPDAVAVSLRIGKPLQNQYAASLTPDITVGRGVESLALSVR